MKLIAKKPCRFGGRKFFINEEIPAEFVACAEVQERLGVLAIVEEKAAEILETEGTDDVVFVPVVKEEDGDTAQVMSVPLSIGETQHVFAIMQMNVPEAEAAIEEVNEENVLIVLHACDSRTGVKKAAKKRAANISSKQTKTNESTGGNDFSEGIESKDTEE